MLTKNLLKYLVFAFLSSFLVQNFLLAKSQKIEKKKGGGVDSFHDNPLSSSNLHISHQIKFI